MNYSEYCERCKHHEFDFTKGIICNLTNEKPHFDDKCEKFLINPEKENQKKTQEKLKSSYDLSKKKKAVTNAINMIGFVFVFISILLFIGKNYLHGAVILLLGLSQIIEKVYHPIVSVILGTLVIIFTLSTSGQTPIKTIFYLFGVLVIMMGAAYYNLSKSK